MRGFDVAFCPLPGNTVMPWQNRERKENLLSRQDIYTYYYCSILAKQFGSWPKMVLKSITITVILCTIYSFYTLIIICNSCFRQQLLTNMNMCVVGSPGFLNKTVKVQRKYKSGLMGLHEQGWRRK